MSQDTYHTFPEWLARVQRILGWELNNEQQDYAYFLFKQGVEPRAAAQELNQ